jgi:hypothetical protein
MEIQHTKNYEIFQKMEGNRHLDTKHLRKLRASIQRENQLAIHPIIVNKQMSVIDGQHRLEVAKELGLDIFYIKSENVSDIHLIEGNVNQKSWEVENFIDYFAIKEKKSDYIKLKELIKLTSLKPKAILSLMIGAISPILLEFLKTGKFQFPSDIDPKALVDFFLRFQDYANDKKLRPVSMFTNFNFTKALRWVYHTTNFSEDIFFKKLDLKWFELKPQRTAQDWYKLLINIYNYKNYDKISDEWSNS